MYLILMRGMAIPLMQMHPRPIIQIICQLTKWFRANAAETVTDSAFINAIEYRPWITYQDCI